VNVTKEIGKFYQNKNNGQPLGITKNRMLKVWISIWRRICFFQSYTEKSLKSRKSDGYGGCFPRSRSLLLFSTIKATFKKKRNVEMLDYLVDDNALTINFNIQLGEAVMV
jgi:hypothetical protein